MDRHGSLDRGYLLIADLSGYTAYLASSEPEHAPIIAADFIETVIASLRGQFRLVKLEGDAALMWAPGARVDGGSLLDAVDAAYFAFQRRLRSVTQATECDCNACRQIPRLDLKFVVHHGDVLRHRVARREELAGRDVIIAHRLLKGTSAGRAGADSYVLITAAAVETLRLDSSGLGMTAITERYAQLGAVHAYLLDLGLRWQGEQQRPTQRRPSGRPVARVERLLPVPPPLAWELLTAPGLRTSWEGIAAVDQTTSGRRGVGTRTSCVVGRLKVIEEILEWRPFDAFARRVAHPELGRVTAIYQLSPMATATHLDVSWFAAGRSPVFRQAARQRRFAAEQSAKLDRLVERAGLEQPSATLPLAELSPAEPANGPRPTAAT